MAQLPLHAQVAQCLKSIKSMSAEQVQKKYGFPRLHDAEMLQTRASDMITKGVTPRLPLPFCSSTLLCC